MAIRYDKKLNQEINKTIKNFNQKIARLEKEERELLPSKITKKELKESVYTRSELQRKLKELQRFSRRGAENIIETTGGVRLTQYELTNIKKENARVKASITRELKRLTVEKPKIFGKKQTSTFSEMGDTDYLNLVARRKALEKDINKLSREEFERFTKLVEKTGRNQQYMNNIFIEENDNYNEEQKTNSSKDEIFKEDSSLIINNTNINQQVGNIIVVEIKGEVINPDVYSLNEGSIIKDLIEAAGGLTNEADISNINRAKEINNHELIVIRNINDSVSNENIEINEIQEIEIDDGKININTADLNRLKDIPGIGDVKANSIIMYREENGGFKTIDELKNVDGIGEKTFEKIKNNIKI